MEFKTKAQLALQLVDRCLQQGLTFGWVTTDGGYGKDGNFLRALDDRNLTFFSDVHGTQKFYDKFPTDLREEWDKDDDFSPPNAITVRDYAANLADHDWKKVNVRPSSKGPILIDIHEKRVWVWNKKEQKPHSWKLVITREHATKDEVKYGLTNAYEFTSPERLAYMQRQRYWIEHSFQVMKGTCGLADYQVRSWTGWHHHVAMVLLANEFIVLEKAEAPESLILISGNDIRELLICHLPSKKVNEMVIFQQLEHRHRQRQASIISAVKKKKERAANDKGNVPK